MTQRPAAVIQPGTKIGAGGRLQTDQISDGAFQALRRRMPAPHRGKLAGRTGQAADARRTGLELMSRQVNHAGFAP